MDYPCRVCGRRLPVKNVVGQVQAWCRHCKDLTLIQVAPIGARVASREQC